MIITLIIHHGVHAYTFQVERVSMDKSFELFKLSAGNRVVVLQSNRPMLWKRGLKRKPITWKVMEGEVKDAKALEKVYKAIEQALEPPKQTPKPTSPFPSLPVRMIMNQPNCRKKSGAPPYSLGERNSAHP